MRNKIWLITGSAHGLGRAIAETALAHGDSVVATARRPELLADLAQRHGDRVAVAALDVSDGAAARAAVELALSRFGRLDVLVNNAGYASLAPFEHMDEDDFEAQMDVNFGGVVRLTRAALPHMRARRSGHIIHISSGAGRLGAPGMSAYHAAKHAVGGFTESVAKEVAPFGVAMVAVEPGSMPTGWAPTALASAAPAPPDYAPSVGQVLATLQGLPGREVGDLARYAQVVFELTRKDVLPARLLLGSDALFAVRAAEAARAAAMAEWEPVTRSTDRAGMDLSFLDGLELS